MDAFCVLRPETQLTGMIWTNRVVTVNETTYILYIQDQRLGRSVAVRVHCSLRDIVFHLRGDSRFHL